MPLPPAVVPWLAYLPLLAAPFVSVFVIWLKSQLDRWANRCWPSEMDLARREMEQAGYTAWALYDQIAMRQADQEARCRACMAEQEASRKQADKIARALRRRKLLTDSDEAPRT